MMLITNFITYKILEKTLEVRVFSLRRIDSNSPLNIKLSGEDSTTGRIETSPKAIGSGLVDETSGRQRAIIPL